LQYRGHAPAFNSENLLEMVEARIHHPILGDAVAQSLYPEYKDFGGIKRSARIIENSVTRWSPSVVVSDVQFR
jgi:hypothetical protein